MASKSKKGLGRGLGALLMTVSRRRAAKGLIFYPIYPIQKSQTAIV